SDPSVYVANTMFGSAGLMSRPEIMYGCSAGRPLLQRCQVSPKSLLRSTPAWAPPVCGNMSRLQREAVKGPVRAALGPAQAVGPVADTPRNSRLGRPGWTAIGTQ